MTEVEKLREFLEENEIGILDITYGDYPIGNEQLAKAIRESILSVQRGEGRDIDLSI